MHDCLRVKENASYTMFIIRFQVIHVVQLCYMLLDKGSGIALLYMYACMFY